MSKLFRASNFYESTKFLFAITKLMCYNYITITRNSLGNLQARTTLGAYIKFIFYILFGVYFLNNLFIQPLYRDYSRSFIMAIAVYAKCRLIVVQPIIGASIAFLNREKIWKLIVKIELIDEKVRKFKSLFLKKLKLIFFSTAQSIQNCSKFLCRSKIQLDFYWNN